MYERSNPRRSHSRLNRRRNVPLRVATLVAAIAICLISLARGDERTDDENRPLADVIASTFSVCALDPKTGECGVAVTTRLPEVGRLVPFVKAGVGAVATQALVRVRYGPEGLKLLEEGLAPDEVIRQLLADDKQAESRQLGIIDAQGRTAVHTGSDNNPYAAARTGHNYTVQGNLLVGPEVLDAVVASLDESAGTGMPLAERMLDAMAAGQRAGGDKRTGQKQSAALVIADPRRPGITGDYLSVNLHVAEHPTPIAELRRQYDTIHGRLGYRTFELVEGRDVVELKQMLHKLGYFRPELEKLPSRLDEPGLAIYDAEAADAVDSFRRSQGLPTPADRLGHARGIVDADFITALKSAFYGSPQQNKEKSNTAE